MRHHWSSPGVTAVWYFRSLGGPVFVGDAHLPLNCERASAVHCRGSAHDVLELTEAKPGESAAAASPTLHLPARARRIIRLYLVAFRFEQNMLLL